MATAPSSFDRRERAAEEVYYRQEERLSILKRLEKLCDRGVLDRSMLEEIRKATSPDVHRASSVEVSPGVFKDVPGELKQREGHVFAHTPVPKPSEVDRMKTGVHAEMGPSKWAPAGGGSIFSFKDSIPEAPARALPPQEAARLARLQAEAEVPSVFGYRLSPRTPGRTFFLGSLLAIWGTAALVAASARTISGGPGAAPEGQAADSAERTYSALGERLAGFFMPWRARVEGRRASSAEVEAEEGDFARALKQRMVEGRA
ncbi:hypothetical protein ACK3TF_000278 [Chlorella vulgaris]